MSAVSLQDAGHRQASPKTGDGVWIDFRLVAYLVIPASVAVVLMGIFAEYFVATVGTGTFLQDLRHFRLDAEVTVPAWYSSSLMLVCSLLLLLIARLVYLKGQAFAWHWAALGVIFGYMSADESSGIHEVLIDPLQQGFDLHGALHFAWVLPGSFVVLLLGLIYLKFLFSLPRSSAVRFFLAGSIYVGGALGMEMLGGYQIDYFGRESFRYIATMIAEESLEITGLTIFLLALMRHLKTNFPNFSLRLVP
jgi:hypothetical protein